jgi:hypothetical protein
MINRLLPEWNIDSNSSASKKLIQIYHDKIKERIGEVWGERWGGVKVV